MPGGLIQLVSTGSEDLYLTDDPQITFFKIIYRRHTNFSIEAIPQKFYSQPDFGERVTCTISKSADLISKIYLIVDIPNVPMFVNQDGTINTVNKFAWINKLGFMMLNRVELEIAGQIIDRHYGDWLYIWNELSNSNGDTGINNMIGHINEITDFSNGKTSYRLHIPLYFWFCKYNGSALPLVALQYSTVKIHVEFNDLLECIKVGPTNSIVVNQPMVTYQQYEYIQQTVNNVPVYGMFLNFDIATQTLQYISINGPFLAPTAGSNYNYTITGLTSHAITVPQLNAVEQNINIVIPSLSLVDAYLLVDFIFLDNNERLRFAKSNHEYLIDQLQFEGDKTIVSNNAKIKLGFSHPCKELIFRCQYNYIANSPLNDSTNYTNYIDSTSGANIIRKATLLLNGNPRFSNRTEDYFNQVQPFQSHTQSPPPGVNIYAFAINPEKHQQSGSLNFSKVDDIVLEISVDKAVSYTNPAVLKVYCFSYNILRIINGLAGVAFSN